MNIETRVSDSTHQCLPCCHALHRAAPLRCKEGSIRWWRVLPGYGTMDPLYRPMQRNIIYTANLAAIHADADTFQQLHNTPPNLPLLLTHKKAVPV